MKNKESLVERLSQVKRNNIFCAGDIMLDQNSFNSSERLSPEGPFPVLKMKSFSWLKINPKMNSQSILF